MSLQNVTSELTPSSSQGPSHDRPKRSRIWAVLMLALLLGLSALTGWQFHRVDDKITQLSREVERADQKSNAALLHASQAEAHAQQAAQQRDQAEAARAQSQAAAELAEQQAQAAQAAAAKAQQKVQQYREQREAELANLQHALSQIAETRRTAMGVIMTLDNNSIRFDFDKATLKPQYREVLSRVAGILTTLRGYRISVYGYTDDIGTQEYNLKLSERRAATVGNYLVKAGLDPNIISTKGYGKADPRVQGDAPQARAANRRVEISIVDATIGSPVQVGPDH